MLLLTPRTSYDAAARRRTRRAAARLRPLLLPAAVVAAALVLSGALSPEPEPLPSGAGPVVPPGRVLVVLSPADPAVLAVAVPGSLVDVYAAPGPGWGPDRAEPGAVAGSGGPDDAAASLLVQGALVVGVPPPWGPAGAGAPGAALTGPATSVTLAVTDDQARTLAGAGSVAAAGGALSLAVRGPATGKGAAPGGAGG